MIFASSKQTREKEDGGKGHCVLVAGMRRPK